MEVGEVIFEEQDRLVGFGVFRLLVEGEGEVVECFVLLGGVVEEVVGGVLVVVQFVFFGDGGGVRQLNGGG